MDNLLCVDITLISYFLAVIWLCLPCFIDIIYVFPVPVYFQVYEGKSFAIKSEIL